MKMKRRAEPKDYRVILYFLFLFTVRISQFKGLSALK
jgi:hypothetical protein